MEGQLTLADHPSYIKSCVKESVSKEGSDKYQEYTWDMQWPFTITLNGEEQKHERWVLVKRIKKGKETLRTLFYGFNEKAPRACAMENILSAIKTQKNRQDFRKTLQKIKESR
jgi:hypothetical protein